MERFKNDRLQKFKSLCDKVDLTSVSGRRDLLDRLDPLIDDWVGQLPNLLDAFSPEEIEQLLLDATTDNAKSERHRVERFVSFVARSGYKDRLIRADERGNPASSRRTTPLHRAARQTMARYTRDVVIGWLFQIYDRYDVNYADEIGLTHFHVACEFGCFSAVDKFLNMGQDPNLRLPETGDTPLHLAVHRGQFIATRFLLRCDAIPNLTNDKGWTPLDVICRKYRQDEATIFLSLFHNDCHVYRETSQVDARDRRGDTQLHVALALGRKRLVEGLLLNGADPNLQDSRGLAPLHAICETNNDEDKSLTLLKAIFRNLDALRVPLRVDARDKLGRTALQLAVKNLMLEVVDFLLDNGANIDGFVFPTMIELDETYHIIEEYFELLLLARVLDVLDRLSARGYRNVGKDGILMAIMNFYHRQRLHLIDPWDRQNRWYESPTFIRSATAIQMSPDLTFYDVYLLRPEEAARYLTYTDYVEFVRLDKFAKLPGPYRLNCLRQLCEKVSRPFFRRWAVRSLMELTNQKLPIEMVELILGWRFAYTSKDLVHVCRAYLRLPEHKRPF